MKIQKLIIHNMASFEDAEIDFSASPLADADLFLITGKTGAGKSTILDAICLALYGTTPRLKNTDMEGAVKDGTGEVQINSPAQLLRENTGGMFVKLTFEGTNGMPYEAEWEIHRSHFKPSGELRKKVWTLENLQTGDKFSGDKEVKPEIMRAVGLDMGQFCRTTMLAQGAFTVFLNSKDEKKAEILEKITGMDIYAKIGALIYARAQEKETEYKNADSTVEGMPHMSEEDIEAAKEEIQVINDEIAKALADRDEMKTKADWLEDEAKIRGQVSTAEMKKDEAKRVTETETFKEEKKRIESWKETIEVRSSLDTETREKEKEKAAKHEIAKMEDRFRQVLSGRLFLQNKERKLTLEQEEMNRRLDAVRSDLPAIENYQKIIGQLDIIDRAAQEKEALTEEINKLDKLLSETLNPARVRAEEAVGLAEKKRMEAEAKQKEAEEAVRKAGLSVVREEKTTLTGEEGTILLAQKEIESYGTAVKNREIEKKAIADKKKELEGKDIRLEELRQLVSTLSVTMEAERIAYERVSTSLVPAAKALRSSLTVGCTCPVCLQEIKTALPTDEEVERRLQELKRPFDAAKKEYDEKNGELGKLDAEIKAERDLLSPREEAFKKDNSVEKCHAAVMEKLKKCGLDTFDDMTEKALSDRLVAIAARLGELDGIIKEGEQLEKVQELAKENYQTAFEYLGKKKETLGTAKEDVRNSEEEKQRKALLRNNHDNAAKRAVEAIVPILPGTRWEQTWQAPGVAFREELGQAEEAYRNAKGRKEEIIKEIGPIATTLKMTDGYVTDIESRIPAWRELPVTEPVELLSLDNAAKGLGDDILSADGRARSASEEAQRAAARVDSFLKAHPTYSRDALAGLSAFTLATMTALETEHAKKEKDVSVAQMELAAYNKLLEEHMGSRPVYEEGDTIKNLRERQEGYDQLAQQLSVSRTLKQKELDDDKTNREKRDELKIEADRLKAIWEKWDELRKMIGDSTGKAFRTIAQSYVLESLVAAANVYMKSLSDERFQLRVTPGTFIILLEDKYLGYRVRPASTISGGESFLVSLALALALSDIGDSLAVDTLFIDEGFGTLSGEPLQDAIDTLRSLHTKAGRQVGIISHIDDLKLKIPVQIQVRQNPKEAVSTVTVVPEK